MEQFISPPIPYELLHGPLTAPDIASARQNGANCYALYRLARKALGVEENLPSEGLYEAVLAVPSLGAEDRTGDLRVGDGISFGPQAPKIAIDRFMPEFDEQGYLMNWRDFPIRHIGIVASVGGDTGPQILHASQYDGKSTIWPLDMFQNFPRYARQFGTHRTEV